MAASGVTGLWHVAVGFIWTTGEKRAFRGNFPNSVLWDCEQRGWRCARPGCHTLNAVKVLRGTLDPPLPFPCQFLGFQGDSPPPHPVSKIQLVAPVKTKRQQSPPCAGMIWMAVGWRRKGRQQRWAHLIEQLCARRTGVAILFCSVWLVDWLLCPVWGSAVQEGWVSMLEVTRRRGRLGKDDQWGEM